MSKIRPRLSASIIAMFAAFAVLTCVVLFFAGIGYFFSLFASAVLHIAAITITAGVVGASIPFSGKLAPAICGATIAILCAITIAAYAFTQI